MGCCFSSDDEKDLQDPDETSRLLANPVGNVQTRPRASDSFGGSVSQQSQKGDEQSALNRILHQTARNVIDVAAIETQTMEQHEYHDRTRLYSNRLNMVLSGSGKVRNYRPKIVAGVPAPQTVLAAPPISPADIQLITSVSEKASKCMKDVKVQHKEELVVPFVVP